MVVDLPGTVGSEEAVHLARRHRRGRGRRARAHLPNGLDEAVDLDRCCSRPQPTTRARHVRQALVTSTRDRLRVQRSPASSTARRGSGTGSQGSTTVDARQPLVGQHRVDRGVVAAGHDEAYAAEDPRRVVGGRLVGLPRLVVAPTGEALLALAAGLGAPLHVPLADLVLDEAAPPSRATAKPPLRTSSTPHSPRRRGRGREGGSLGRAVVRTREGQPGREVRAVDRPPRAARRRRP